MKLTTQCFFFLTLLLVLHSAMAEEKQEELSTQKTSMFRRPIGFEADASASKHRTVWPELLHRTPEEAEPKIKMDMPEVQIQVVPYRDRVTTDYDIHRVRLYINAARKIIKTPQIG